MTKQRLWTPTFVGLSVANFGSSMIFYLLVPTMATYATDAFGATAIEGGTLASSFFIGALVARLISGAAVDRFGSRNLALAAAAIYLLSTAAYLMAPTLAATLAVRLLNGFGFGLFSSSLTSGVMLTLPPNRRGEGAGWFGIGISVSVGLGPFLALTLTKGPLGMRGVFLAALGCAALAFGLVATLGRGLPGPPAATGAQGHDGAPVWRTLLDRRALGLGVVVMFAAFGYSGILTFLDLATVGTDLAPAASLFFLVYSAVVLIGRPTTGRLQDTFGEYRVLGPALVLMVVGVALVAAASHGFVLLTAAALLGLGWGSITSGGQAAAASRVPRERTGAGVATFFFLLDLGTGVGPIVLGALVAPFGYRGVFVAGTLSATVALAIYASMFIRSRRPGGPRAA